MGFVSTYNGIKWYKQGGNAMPTPNDRKYTAEEFFKLIPETNEHIELINGEIVEQAAPTEIHQDIVGGLYSEFRSYIRRKGGNCKPFIAPLDVKLDDNNVVQPDVFIVCDPDKRDGKRINGSPDLVVEVVSTNRSDDYSKKLEIYKNFGVREYWIIDPAAERVLVYLFSDSFSINIYTFDQPIPVGIYGGELTITIGDML